MSIWDDDDMRGPTEARMSLNDPVRRQAIDNRLKAGEDDPGLLDLAMKYPSLLRELPLQLWEMVADPYQLVRGAASGAIRGVTEGAEAAGELMQDAGETEVGKVMGLGGAGQALESTAETAQEAIAPARPTEL